MPKISSSKPFFLVDATVLAVDVEMSLHPLLLLAEVDSKTVLVLALTGLVCLVPPLTQFCAPPERRSSNALLVLATGFVVGGEANELFVLNPLLLIERLPVSGVRLLTPLLKLCCSCWGGLYTGCGVGAAAYSDRIDFFRSGLELCVGVAPEAVGIGRAPGAGLEAVLIGELKSKPIRLALGCCFCCWGIVGVGLLMLLGGTRWCWPLLYREGRDALEVRFRGSVAGGTGRETVSGTGTVRANCYKKLS